MSRYPKVAPARGTRRRPREFVPNIGGADIAPAAIRSSNLLQRRRVRVEDIESGRFVHGYLEANTPTFQVPHFDDWTRPGGWNNDLDLRVRLGHTSVPLLADFKGQLGWDNTHATDSIVARVCAVLYTGDWANAGFHKRSEAVASEYIPVAGNFRTIPLLTSFIVPASTDVTDSRTGLPADWHLGFQVQYADASETVKSGQRMNRQSITCTFYAAPFFGSDENDQAGSTFSPPLSRLVTDPLLV